MKSDLSSKVMSVTIVMMTLSMMTMRTDAYCWQAGYNPGFTGPPEVDQVSLDVVRVSWSGLVKHRECADQFLVKYWHRSSPNDYTTSELLPSDSDFVELKVVPKITYQFQAVAREDKGMLGGIDWNRSPIVDFKTSVYNDQVQSTMPDNQKPRGAEQRLSSSDMRDSILRSGVLETEYDGDKPILVAGIFTLEAFVALVVIVMSVALIVVGVIYKLTCGPKMKKYDVDEEEEMEDEEEDDNKEKNDDNDDDEDQSVSKKLEPEEV